MSSNLDGVGSSSPKGHVALQLVARQLLLAEQEGVCVVHVELAVTAVMEAKLVVKVMGGNSAPSC